MPSASTWLGSFEVLSSSCGCHSANKEGVVTAPSGILCDV